MLVGIYENLKCYLYSIQILMTFTKSNLVRLMLFAIWVYKIHVMSFIKIKYMPWCFCCRNTAVLSPCSRSVWNIMPRDERREYLCTIFWVAWHKRSDKYMPKRWKRRMICTIYWNSFELHNVVCLYFIIFNKS